MSQDMIDAGDRHVARGATNPKLTVASADGDLEHGLEILDESMVAAGATRK